MDAETPFICFFTFSYIPLRPSGNRATVAATAGLWELDDNTADIARTVPNVAPFRP
jgi:hypothetical protein